ncbi:MAG: hypothetical protein V7K35_15735 [Nostoc sp.]|uniref:hypothetical protein n=1 Tax=Nostoc sp. TaxID=1180 RepID=UPI002FF62F98
MVERKIISEEDLQYFLLIHPLELYTSLNRDFFKGTAVEKTADEFLVGAVLDEEEVGFLIIIICVVF